MFFFVSSNCKYNLFCVEYYFLIKAVYIEQNFTLYGNYCLQAKLI